MALERGGFVLELDQVEELKARFNFTESELMYNLIEPTQRVRDPQSPPGIVVCQCRPGLVVVNGQRLDLTALKEPCDAPGWMS
jgi:hypothetical protein